MPGTYRAIYDDEAVIFSRDTTSSFTAAGLTATNYIWCGASNWTISIPSSLTAAPGGISGNITIQANNSNPVTRAATGLQWTVNPLQNQPSQGGRKFAAYNNGFTANWVDVATLSAGYTLISISNIPVRYVRLTGLGLTATNFVAFIWTDQMTKGN